MTLQDVGLSTFETREYLIRRFIRPSFGTCELGSLTTEDITRWENGIPAENLSPEGGPECRGKARLRSAPG